MNKKLFIMLVFLCFITACATSTDTKHNTTYEKNNRTLKSRIFLALYKNGIVQHNDIDVKVTDHKVKLSGTVKEAPQIKDALEITRSIIHKRKIENHLTVGEK